ncbi:MAG: hypothetical protein WDZ44_00030, partial [Candidatus Spechtbacterales bacterium]
MSIETILEIDRSIPFNSLDSIHRPWAIVEQDSRSLALTRLDLSKVSFVTMGSGQRGSDISNEEHLRRLKEANYIPLDAQIFQTLLENQHLIPEEWNQHERIVFFGTLFWDPKGIPEDRWYYALYLMNGGDRRLPRWSWYYTDTVGVSHPQW